MERRIYISVINDLVTDQRVHRLASLLRDSGYDVTLIGRKLKHSQPFRPDGIKSKRFRLLFNHGFLFYASYNIRLCFFLLFRKGPFVLVANDLDTLPANFLVSKFRRANLVYDSHEYFTEVPELTGRKFVKGFWQGLEKYLVPRVDSAFTVNSSLAKMYSAKYGIEFDVVRNVPDMDIPEKETFLPELFMKEGFIIYQGAVNKDRGLGELLEIIAENRDFRLLIAGDGDMMHELKSKVEELQLYENVFFSGKLEPGKLKYLTCRAKIGISLEKKTNLNYYYALPNKLFDYIIAGIPVLCSAFPEMRNIVENYKVGMIVDPKNRDNITESLRIVLYDEEKRREWIENIQLAAETLNWKEEQARLEEIFKKVNINIQVEA